MTLKTCIIILGSTGLFVYNHWYKIMDKDVIKDFLLTRISIEDLKKQYILSERESMYLQFQKKNFIVGDYLNIDDAIDCISKHLQIKF